MTNAEKRQLLYFPKALDKAIKDTFGITATTELNIFNGRYVTTWGKCSKALGKEVQAFINGYTAGNQELAERIFDKSKWIK